MCANRQSADDVDAIREELAALVVLSAKKLEEMREIQTRIDELAIEIAQLIREAEESDPQG